MDNETYGLNRRCAEHMGWKQHGERLSIPHSFYVEKQEWWHSPDGSLVNLMVWSPATDLRDAYGLLDWLNNNGSFWQMHGVGKHVRVTIRWAGANYAKSMDLDKSELDNVGSGLAFVITKLFDQVMTEAETVEEGKE